MTYVQEAVWKEMKFEKISGAKMIFILEPGLRTSFLLVLAVLLLKYRSSLYCNELGQTLIATLIIIIASATVPY